MSSQLSDGSPSFHSGLSEFERARRAAALEQVVARLSGRSSSLLSFEEVARRLHITGRAARGQREIPVDAIVGSVGRYNDFTSTFLPRIGTDAERWAAVRAAAPDVSHLPPVEVYQLGDGYFVLDGNHRVSIARRQGQQFIAASVIEVRTRVPFSASDSAEAFIVKAEYAAFLEYTRLDRLRPGADLRITAAGQVATLENLIEVHRFVLETKEERELPFSEAVERWYDESYLPVVGAIRELSILDEFPGRTETDFYLWIVTHLIPLQRELGWEVQPESAMAALAASFQPRRAGLRTRLRTRLLQLWPGRESPAGEKHAEILARQRMLARYGDRLFTNLLVAISGPDSEALVCAIAIARREEAEIHALYLPDATAPGTPSSTQVERIFAQVCAEAGVEGVLVEEEAAPIDSGGQRLLARAPFSDLLIVERLTAVGEILKGSPCPVLIAGSSIGSSGVQSSGRGSLSNLLLVAEGDDRTAPGAGPFIAAYMAERWQVPLIVAQRAEMEGPSSELRNYLEMHEVEALYEQVAEPFVEGVLRVAERQGTDLIIVSGRRRGRLGRQLPNEMVEALAQQWAGPLLVSF